MKYVTEEEANKAANISTQAAIKCSIKHWKQLLKAPKKDFGDTTENAGKTVWPSAKTCALCHRFVFSSIWEKDVDSCRDKCPLSLIGQNCYENGSAYDEALQNCRDWTCGKVTRNVFTNSCKEMIEVLESCLEN